MSSPPIVKLESPVQHYAWGSHEAIARLQGRAWPTRDPEAELWIGDHPSAPSQVLGPDGAVALEAWIERDLEPILGPNRRRLPFLAKLLAAERSLSVQVHPNAEQARRGFERESRAAVPPERRSYRDAEAKHELLIALTEFEALCGFRPDAEVAPHLDAFPSLASSRDERGDRPLAVRLFFRLQGLDGAERDRLADELETFARGDDVESAWARRLAGQHPGDPLAMAPVLLNPVVLAPGQALVVPPGTVHSYLSGTGLEVMTRSDNVVRGGLTQKHTDAGELAAITVPRAGPPLTSEGRASADGTLVYATGTDAFGVGRYSLGAGGSVELSGGSVAVLVCVEGNAVVSGGGGEVALRAGEAALVPAGIEGYRLSGSAGPCRIFRVSSG